MSKHHYVALVTGASRGIGRSIAIDFAEKGYSVAVNYYQNKEKAEDLVAHLISTYHVQAIAVQCDVSCAEEVTTMIQTIQKSLGQISILVNNAGIANQQLFTDITLAQWDRVMDVDVKGVFLCTQGVAPAMIANKYGRIINISSIWGMTGASCEVHYSTAKAAVIGFTKALAKELGPSGITVNCVAPGVIDTEMNGKLDQATIALLKEETPVGEIGKCEDIAYTVGFLACPQAGFITGQVISPNGGIVI